MLPQLWFFLPPPSIFLKKCSLSKPYISSCLLLISHVDDMCPLQDFSLSPQSLCSFSLETRSCFTALSQPSSSGCKELVKGQRKVEECSKSPLCCPHSSVELSLLLLHHHPHLPLHFRFRGCSIKSRGRRQTGRAHQRGLVFSEVYTTSQLPGSSLSQPNALLLYPSLPQLW